VSALFAAGLLTLMFSDYTRRHRPIMVRAKPIGVVVPQRTERFGLAA
jgi:hypothetical protein